MGTEPGGGPRTGSEEPAECRRGQEVSRQVCLTVQFCPELDGASLFGKQKAVPDLEDEFPLFIHYNEVVLAPDENSGMTFCEFGVCLDLG